MYTATNTETGAKEIWTEEQVRAEIIDTYQHDMGIVFGDGMSDEEIEAGVKGDDIADHLQPDGSFDGFTYQITKNKYGQQTTRAHE